MAPGLAQLWHSLAAPGCRCRLAQHFQHAVLLLQSNRAASLGRAEAAEGAISRKKKKIKKKKPNPQPQASKHLLQAQLPRPAQEELLEMVSSGIQVKPSPLELPQHHPGEGSREEKLFQKPQILHPSAGITPSSSSATSWAPGTAPRPPGVTQVQLQREQGSCAAPGSQSPPKILPRSVLGSSRLTGSCRPGWPPGRPSPRRPPERSGWCPPGPPRGKSPQSPPSPSGSPATPSWRRPGRL